MYIIDFYQFLVSSNLEGNFLADNLSANLLLT